MDIILIVWLLVLLVTLWLNVLATMAIRYDHSLDKTQKTGQQCIVWLIPILGASVVLHLVYEHSPEAIPKSWIPWPLKKLIFGKPLKDNRYRDEHEIDYRTGSGGGRHHDSDGGSSD